MGIKRYTATKDATITNAFKANLSNRATGSNMGAADTLEVFSIFAQANSASSELSRALIQFPVSTIVDDRNTSAIPASGSVDFVLKLYNAEHTETLPKQFTITVAAVSRVWTEGTGLDMETYKDLGACNWESASLSASTDNGLWTTQGGDHHLDASSSFDFYFDKGTEDLEVNITPLVEQWLSQSIVQAAPLSKLPQKENYGIQLLLTASQETYFSSSTNANEGAIIHNLQGATKSYYTKK